ncbi:MAG: methyl-accepting chemotaxis protein [Lachnospiraceae bacterium]|nr:methyl-accepting chemotaxis protein [Lachnospiraceae bacterium]
MKGKLSLKGSIISIVAAMGISLISSILFFAFQVNTTSKQAKDMYYDKLYSISEKLLNADRDLYQAMLGAFHYRELCEGWAPVDTSTISIDELKGIYLGNWTENIDQFVERVENAVEIAKTNDLLYNVEKDENGKSFAENYKAYQDAYNLWRSDFDVVEQSGSWAMFCIDYETVREGISYMTDITEAWAIKEAEILTEEANQRIMKLLIIFVFILIVITILAVFVILKMRASLKNFEKATLKLAEGDFATVIDVKSPFKEFVNLSNENEDMRQKLKSAVSSVIDNAGKVAEGASHTKDSVAESQTITRDISMAVENLALGAGSMADDVQTTSSITIEIGGAIDNVYKSVQETLKKVKMLADSSKEIQSGLYDIRKADEETDEKAGEVADSVNETAALVNKISSAADGIINIAGQTNLLALNASIEAARAGEAGRGFAVVAENIKDLATETNRLAGEITAMLKDISNYSERNIGLTSSIKEATTSENIALSKMVESFDAMLEVLDEAKSENEDTAHQTEFMNSKKDGIVDAVSSLSSISEENAASTEETSASLDQLNNNMVTIVEKAVELADIANTLKESVAFFKI